MKAIIIDDEKKGRETLSSLIKNYCTGVEVLDMGGSAQEGYEMINRLNPDVVFLDIEMPNGNGFFLLEKFEEIKFQIIFTTAFDNYAIKAIKYHALDYLLKPIDIDELRIAVENAKKKSHSLTSATNYAAFVSERKLLMTSRIALPIKDGVVYLGVSDIVRVESDGSYSTFYTSDLKKYMVSKNLKEYEDLLPQQGFFRSHKSHLINIKKVKKFLRNDGNFVEMEDGSVVEISRRKKDDFFQLMENQN